MAPKTILLATGNAHKVAEIRAILGNRFRFVALNDFAGVPAVAENASTFSGNATRKATGIARWASAALLQGLPAMREKIHDETSTFVLADDSGLEVDALNGAPGVRSARFAAETANSGNTPDAENLAKLLRLMKPVPQEQRTARFRCAVAITPLAGGTIENASPVCYSDEYEVATQIFEGTCEGRIAESPSGAAGFGYDPVFIPAGHSRSFAELGDELKHQLSHRGKALALLRKAISTGRLPGLP
ncbi:MAG TPA: non-canonical purine NTP pyrophosphatase [Verrucomicrobiae bacterium]|nr:non-canonical purine NTP pyrophosphatase [Verrucomicrobiae bacterium]